MDHIIDSLKSWLEILEEFPEEDRNIKAEKCVKAALKELYKYYD